MPEVMKPNHQSHRLGRGAVVFAKLLTQGTLEEGPVDLPGQFDQRVIQIDDGFQFNFEQVALEIGVAAGTGFHQFAGFLQKSLRFLANKYTLSSPLRTCFIGLSAFFIDD